MGLFVKFSACETVLTYLVSILASSPLLVGVAQNFCIAGYTANFTGRAVIGHTHILHRSLFHACVILPPLILAVLLPRLLLPLHALDGTF